MLKKVLVILGAAIAVLLIVIATRPSTYRVERSARIEAPAEAVFAVVSDFSTFAEWSPWEKRDPAMRRTLSTPPSGVGATYAWEGNKDVGKGKMTITEAQAPTRVRQRLEFIEPFASVADVGFDVKPEGGDAATATWWMSGNNNFMSKAFTLFMNMDEMIGKDYEEGLANLKRVVEARRAAPPAAEAAAPPAAAGAATP
jgi:uncharacterized protein YndB with AHSA1/START domain